MIIVIIMKNLMLLSVKLLIIAQLHTPPSVTLSPG